jgi:hypothetical protein
MAPTWCQVICAFLLQYTPLMLRKIKHIYDVIGCDWNMPANYGASVFENCQGDSGEV